MLLGKLCFLWLCEAYMKAYIGAPLTLGAEKKFCSVNSPRLSCI